MKEGGGMAGWGELGTREGEGGVGNAGPPILPDSRGGGNVGHRIRSRERRQICIPCALCELLFEQKNAKVTELSDPRKTSIGDRAVGMK